jgi:serine/threonine-protein kinase/endoribonuclease IRE1
LDKLFLRDGDPKKYLGPMPSTIDVLLQLSKGLEYVHEQKLVHRDIKPENVLIWVNQENGEVLMKWADFGLSKPVNERGSCSMSGVKGTTGWLAPEVLKLIESEEANETQIRGTVKTDVFAEGLVFGYFLLGGGHLFGSFLISQSNIVKNQPVNLPSKYQVTYQVLLLL